ncbi:MAG: glycosyltransferase [Candidatus Gracilibacteria bacterium]
MKCDIIIPVYNGYHFLKECVDSVIAHTDLNQYRIVLIDDCSTEKEAVEYMDALARDNIATLLRNEVNLGFVGSVNKGMKWSEIDVVLLNSDAVVTKGWMEKMYECYQSYPNVGSVTPLTNNGTVCSIPNWLEDNAIPEGLTADSYAELVERISLRSYPQLPTAVGFCMLIGRRCLEEVGYFDEERFGKGYGEENEWCMRAEKFGYIHLLDDATFVHHKGSMTFGNSPEKLKKQQENLAKLLELYPDYEKRIHEYILRKPLEEIHNNVKAHLAYANGKRNILLVLHMPIRGAIGGTELHVKDIVEHFSDTYNFFLLYPVGIHYWQLEVLGAKDQKYIFPFEVNLFTSSLNRKETHNVLGTILHQFSISLVHIHHLLGFSLDVPEIVKKFGVPVLFTVHDFYYYANHPQLLGTDDILEGFDKTSYDLSRDGMLNKYEVGNYESYLKSRRAVWKRIFTQVADKIIVPSKFVEKKVKEFIGEDAAPVAFIDHPSAYLNAQEPGEKPNDTSKILKVAFLGTFTRNKGAALFAEIVKELRKRKVKVEFYIIGAVGDWKTYYSIKNNVHHIAFYDRDKVVSLLKNNGIELILMPAQAYETFSYTLSEAQFAGIPVIATTMGALEERVHAEDTGWTFSNETYIEETLSLVEKIAHDKTLLHNKIKNLKNFHTNSSHDNSFAKYAELYSAFNKKTPAEMRLHNHLSDFTLKEGGSRYNIGVRIKNMKFHTIDSLYRFLVNTKLIFLIRPVYNKIKRGK